ncbi:MAG: galactokinase [Granulosicoccus sp.]
MSSSGLQAQSIDSLIADCEELAINRTGLSDAPRIVVSPYRFNPLGAHIDHQGGSVMARSLNQYTVLVFWPNEQSTSTLHSRINSDEWETTQFAPGELADEFRWDAMARASATALAHSESYKRGITGVVFGTLVSGGLSSSASVILAYLSAMAAVNNVRLSATQLVELCRQVENDYRGLNNGIQDQMSIAFGHRDHMVLLDVEQVTAQPYADPQNISDVRFLMCYSGVSRDLAGSAFNTRVAECQQAAALLHPGAAHLGQVPEASRSAQAISALPAMLARRAKHIYTEMERVYLGIEAWQKGDWQVFGELMNASCQSSINNYESGSEWLIALHELATELPGVYGNRFSGGGYGGCLFMLVDSARAETIGTALLEQYLACYPELESKARVLIAESESTVRIVTR